MTEGGMGRCVQALLSCPAAQHTRVLDLLERLERCARCWCLNTVSATSVRLPSTVERIERCIDDVDD